VVTGDISPVEGTARRGRRPVTSARQLELIGLRLFTEQGYDETTIEQIAVAAGVNRRTFFNYFSSKAAVVLHTYDDAINALRAGFADIGEDVPLMDAIRQVVVGISPGSTEDLHEFRIRMNLIVSVPTLREGAAPYYEAWELVVSEFAAKRIGQPADSVFPLAIGRTVLAAALAASADWVARADADLTAYLDAALTALGGGFTPSTLIPPARLGRRRTRRSPARPNE